MSTTIEIKDRNNESNQLSDQQDPPSISIPNNERNQSFLKPMSRKKKTKINEENNTMSPLQQKQKESYTKKKPAQPRRRVLNRFETAPQEGWRLIKKWVGNNNRNKSKQQKNLIPAIERQAEVNSITPLIMNMFFTKDEDDKKRIPVFLNNLNVKISKLEEHPDEEENYFNYQKNKPKKFRGTIFKITIQYGNGPGAITWCVYRRYWDFVKLHYRYKKKYNNSATARSRLPNFPSLPRHHFRKQKRRDYEERLPMSRLATAASYNTDGEERIRTNPNSLMDEEAVMALVTKTSATTQDNQSSSNQSHSHFMLPIIENNNSATPSIASSQVMEVVKADKNVLQAMENYLNQFIHSFEPTGYINRLCKFLEISALGLSLAARNPMTSLHGKEGYAVFQSRTDRDPKQTRKFLQDGLVCSIPTTGGRRRRKPKWFIVRESFIICVDDPSDVSNKNGMIFYLFD